MKSLSRVRLLATPWTAAHQAPPSMGFSKQEYWSEVPLPSPSEMLGTLIAKAILKSWKAHTSQFQNLLQSYSHEDHMARREGRRTDQQNEVGSADTNPSIYNQLTFHEGASPSFPNYPGTTAGGPHAKQWSQTHPPPRQHVQRPPTVHQSHVCIRLEL